MAVIVNNPSTPVRERSSGLGMILGIILLVVLALMLFRYGLPYVNGGYGASAPQINVPGKIDVNVNNPGAK